MEGDPGDTWPEAFVRILESVPAIARERCVTARVDPIVGEYESQKVYAISIVVPVTELEREGGRR